jgi:hypothetical protein
MGSKLKAQRSKLKGLQKSRIEEQKVVGAGCISANLFLSRKTVEGSLKENEHRISFKTILYGLNATCEGL